MELLFINKLKSEHRKNIYCDGEAEIIHLLMRDYLIDEYIVFLKPVMLVEGKLLFRGRVNSLDIK